MGDSTYIRRIRCSRFYRYTIELIDRFFLDASLMTAILPVERLVSNRLYIETWVIPRHWNGAYSIDLIRGALLYARRPRRKPGVNLSVGIILVLEFEFAVIFPQWNTTTDDISRHKLDACAFNNRPDERVARHGYNDNRGIRILLPLLASFSV